MPDRSPSQPVASSFHLAVGSHFLPTPCATGAPSLWLVPGDGRSPGLGVALGQLLIGPAWVCAAAMWLWCPAIGNAMRVVRGVLRLIPL